MLTKLYETNSQNWGSELQKYSHDKKNLAWGHTEPPKIVTQKEMKERDCVFNPILQVYKNKEHDQNKTKQDKQNLINQLAINKDNQLRSEQTYDILTLNNKLKGLEDKNNYPKLKKEEFKKIENTKLKYNLISNITLDKHNYLRPEDRPKIDDRPPDTKSQIVSTTTFRDYDIISNKYKDNHEPKTKLDNEIFKISAAKLYNKNNDYNPIQAKFYDDEKENEFNIKRDENNKIIIKNKNKPIGEGDLYNPINMSIVDHRELQLADQKSYNKKKRFQLRYDIENFHMKKDLVNKFKKEQLLDGKLSYQRFKDMDERGYNILNSDQNTFKDHKNTIPFKDSKSHWEILQDFAQDGKFDKQEVYKDPYDFSNVVEATKKFKNDRKKNLPKISNDSEFAVKILNRKNDYKKVRTNSFSKTHYHSNIDKDKWFKNDKDNVYEDGKIQKINYNQNKNNNFNKTSSKIRLIPPIFLENKLKKKKNKLF